MNKHAQAKNETATTVTWSVADILSISTVICANGLLTVAMVETIHLEHLPAGMYFFRLEKDNRAKTIKVIKE